MTRNLLIALVTAAGVLVVAPAASAFTTLPVWQCRGSAAFASVAGNNRVEPIVANGNINTANGASPDRAQCVDSETGLGNTPTQLGISPEFLGAVTGKASTAINPDLGRAIDQTIAAEGRVEDLTLLLGAGGPTLGVGAANSVAFGRCVAGNLAPQFAGDSRVADITLGGTPIALDRLADELTKVLNPILGAVVEVRVDERIQTPDSLTINALHIIVVRGETPLLDLVVGQAKVGANGPVCDPARQNDGSGLGQVCPPGSTLVVERNLCVIPAGTGGSSLGEIVIGPPFQGPSGGMVIPLDVARKRFGRSPCVAGGGRPLFVIVGTNGADRITGTNVADRILGLRGKDRIDGGRGNDCLEGNRDRDVLSGALGRDRVFGGAGNDALRGGADADRLSAGSGNDTINGGYGADRVLGGSGNDAINVATAGPPARINCGTGFDKLRINRNEVPRNRNCERIYVLPGPGGGPPRS
ncbi:MAG TPA: calcium-binding protein [Solirubrobacteraceae bacterium]|nr:calcium-binding protein [Solirubrobacteraceae bacterium]